MDIMLLVVQQLIHQRDKATSELKRLRNALMEYSETVSKGETEITTMLKNALAEIESLADIKSREHANIQNVEESVTSDKSAMIKRLLRKNDDCPEANVDLFDTMMGVIEQVVDQRDEATNLLHRVGKLVYKETILHPSAEAKWPANRSDVAHFLASKRNEHVMELLGKKLCDPRLIDADDNSQGESS